MVEDLVIGENVRVIEDFIDNRPLSSNVGQIMEFKGYLSLSDHRRTRGYYYKVGPLETIMAKVERVECPSEKPFPQNWYIIRNSANYEVLNDWINSKGVNRAFMEDRAYVYPDGTYHKSMLYHDHEEITFEQFKTHVLNIKEMEKEIIGYKLIKKYPATNMKIGEIAYDVPNTVYSDWPEYWEPVYNELPVAGDWLYILDTNGNLPGGSDGPIRVGNVLELKEIEAKNSCGNINATFVGGQRIRLSSRVKGHYERYYRKATLKEIENASIVEIRGYRAHSDLKGIVTFGCQSFSHSELLAYKKLLNKEVAATITIRQTEVTIDMLDKLIRISGEC